jgi:hypothetical protein
MYNTDERSFVAVGEVAIAEASAPFRGEKARAAIVDVAFLL